MTFRAGNGNRFFRGLSNILTCVRSSVYLPLQLWNLYSYFDEIWTPGVIQPYLEMIFFLWSEKYQMTHPQATKIRGFWG